MKKLLIGCLVSGLALSSIQAKDLSFLKDNNFIKDCKVSLKSGVSFLNTKINDQDNSIHHTGFNLGVEVSKNIDYKLIGAVELNQNIYNDTLSVFNIELNSKYLVYDKTRLISGISYNMYSVSGNNPAGFGIQFGVERQLVDNFDLTLKYKYMDLNKYLKNATDFSLSVKYNF